MASRVRRVDRKRRRHRIYGVSRSVEECRNLLENARSLMLDDVGFWRQALSLAAAKRRAAAGDRTAELRLAWIATVGKLVVRAEYAARRFKTIDQEVSRMLRGGAPCGCCAQRLSKLQQLAEEYLADIAKLPSEATTYAEFSRRSRAQAAAAEAWLRRQLERLGK